MALFRRHKRKWEYGAARIIPSTSSHKHIMEYRLLGGSGFKVPVLSFGTGTFGGKGEFFGSWGNNGNPEATRLVDICLEHGLNFFDTADIYSGGMAEEILGHAIQGRRDAVLISTKATFRSGEGPNDVGSSRFHLVRAVEASLQRLGTDYIDLFQLHGFDALTPNEPIETSRALPAQKKLRRANVRDGGSECESRPLLLLLLDVAAELKAHRGDHFVLEFGFAARAEALVE